MPELKTSSQQPTPKEPLVVVAIVAAGLFLLSGLYLGLSRHYNAQELETLVEGAEANGQSYSLTIQNELTGRYSFNIE